MTIKTYDEKNITPKKGDILYTKRILYSHYGVYIGNGKVIHFAASEGAETNAARADIHEATVQEFLKDGQLYVLEDPEGFTPLPPEIIVNRAKSKLEKCKGEYNLVTNNCEHFAFWCRYGESFSQQVDDVADFVAGLCLIPFSILNIFNDDFSESSQSEIKKPKVDCFKFTDLLSFFRKNENQNLLKSNPDFIAVCIKENQNDKTIILNYGIFDKSKNKMERFSTVEAKQIDTDLENAFGEKSMIVLS